MCRSSERTYQVVDPESYASKDQQESSDDPHNDKLESTITALVRLSAELILWKIWRRSI